MESVGVNKKKPSCLFMHCIYFLPKWDRLLWCGFIFLAKLDGDKKKKIELIEGPILEGKQKKARKNKWKAGSSWSVQGEWQPPPPLSGDLDGVGNLAITPRTCSVGSTTRGLAQCRNTSTVSSPLQGRVHLDTKSRIDRWAGEQKKNNKKNS